MKRVCLVSAIDGFRASPASYYGTAASGTAAGTGPAGSSSMTFFCVVVPRRGVLTRMLFGRRNDGGSSGWGLFLIGTPGTFVARVANSTPADMSVTAAAMTTFEDFGAPYLLLASYQNGTLTFWLNGVLAGTTTLGAGFTPRACPTTIGVGSATASDYAIGQLVSDCGMLDAYDAASFVSTLYGNGGPGLSAMWLDDLREGRYLTWPRAAVANSDWHWAAKDVNDGMAVLPTWTDRYTAQAMTKFGQPQGASFPALL